MEDFKAEFKYAMQTAGYGLDDSPIADGKPHRFPCSDRNGDKAGWYVLHGDGVPAGSFGDWRSGQSFTWCLKQECDLTHQEREQYRQRIEEQKRIRKAEEKQTRDKAAERARKIWDAAKQANPDHPYLKKKQVKPFGIRQDTEGNLLIPVRNPAGELTSIQTIDAEGKKLFLSGGQKRGCCFAIKGDSKTFCIGEGYATASSIHEATGAPVIVSFDAGNLLPVAEALRSKHPDARIVICGDNDQWTEGNPGATKATAAAKAIGAEVVLPRFKDLSTKPTDFNDLAVLEGLQAVKTQVTGQAPNRFTAAMISGTALDEEFKKQLSLTWRIYRVIPESAYLLEIYGLPGTYKSFIAQDMALSIAAGIEWHGRKVKKCRVVYVAAEGQAGALKRVKAWKQYHGIDTVEFFTLLPLPCLLDEQSELDQFIDALKLLPGPVGLVVIDTLARSMAGDENGTSDMGKVVIACGRITEATGAQVLLVHHTGKDTARGPRGAIALTGATDCLFEVRKEADRLAMLLCERQKDDEPFEPMTFNLEIQTTGYVNDDMEDIVSLVPAYDSEATPAAKAPKVTGSRRVALDVLKKLYRETGAPVHLDAWRDAAYGAGITASTDQSAKRKAFQRAVQGLRTDQNVECRDDEYWPVKH